MRLLACLAALATLCTTARALQLPEQYPHVPPDPGTSASQASICTVVRTYWGHDRGSQTGLMDLLGSLQRQAFTR